MATLFLFGAGASFGNPYAMPTPPPLGAQLFDELVRRFASARSVPEDVSVIFRSNFEQGMQAFYETRSGHVPVFLRDMGKYFAEFSPTPGNYYEELGRIVRDAGHQAIYATLNYELLLECSLANVGWKIDYAPSDNARDAVRVLKIHGSCNFLPAMRRPFANVVMNNVTWQNWQGEDIVAGPIRPATPEECREFYRGRDSRGPAMAMYMPGKRSLCSHEAILDQQAQWKTAARTATRTFCIGCRVVPGDDHVWGPLARAKTPLYYVGLEPSEFTEWARDTQRKQTFVLARTFEESLSKITRILRLGRRLNSRGHR